MNTLSTPTPERSRPHLLGVLAGLFLAGGMVVATMVFSRTWMKIKDDDTITVTGSARRNIESDMIVWSGAVVTEAPDLNTAQRQLHDQVALIQAFFTEKGITNATFKPMGITAISGRYDKDGEKVAKTFGYRLTQDVMIRSTNLDLVLGMDRDTSKLVAQGLVFTSSAPQFIWTHAGEAKVEMLGEASRDARERASQIAGQGGRTISKMRTAHMGVFQIAPVYSVQTSWDGMSDTSSREKTVTAVLSATFGLQ